MLHGVENTHKKTINCCRMLNKLIQCIITQYGSTAWHWFSTIKCVHKEIVIFTFNVHLFGLLAASL